MTNNTKSLESKLNIDAMSMEFDLQTKFPLVLKDLSEIPIFLETILTNIKIPETTNYISVKIYGKSIYESYESAIDTPIGKYDFAFYQRVPSKLPDKEFKPWKYNFISSYNGVKLEKDKITIEFPKQEYLLT